MAEIAENFEDTVMFRDVQSSYQSSGTPVETFNMGGGFSAIGELNHVRKTRIENLQNLQKAQLERQLTLS